MAGVEPFALGSGRYPFTGDLPAYASVGGGEGDFYITRPAEGVVQGGDISVGRYAGGLVRDCRKLCGCRQFCGTLHLDAQEDKGAYPLGVVCDGLGLVYVIVVGAVAVVAQPGYGAYLAEGYLAVAFDVEVVGQQPFIGFPGNGHEALVEVPEADAFGNGVGKHGRAGDFLVVVGAVGVVYHLVPRSGLCVLIGGQLVEYALQNGEQ